MSTSDLYTVFKTKSRHIAEYSNGHGTAPAIWGYLCNKYLHMERHSWISGVQKDLWNLADNPDVPKELRIVHAFTFDRAICPIDKIDELADACDKVYTLTHEDCPNNVNHWQAVANSLRNVKKDKRALGIGLSCTSISDPWCDWNGKQYKVWDIFEVLK